VRDVLHELVDAVAGLRGITGNRQAELHEQLDEQPEPAPKAKAKAEADPDGAA
jgi:hypothetical protein